MIYIIVVSLIVFITFAGDCLFHCFYSDELDDASEEPMLVQVSLDTNRDSFELQNRIKEASNEIRKPNSWWATVLFKPTRFNLPTDE